MGVLGLWQLLAPVGQPVTLESLENKIFAVDISIWLNQAVKGYRDSTGGSVPNAHLLSLFSRLCKLLFYKIRPIIVFDGGFPELKKQTIINRRKRRAAVKQTSRDIGLKILTNYLASHNLAKNVNEPTIGKTVIRPKEKTKDEIFMLPPLTENFLEESFESSGDNFNYKFTNFNREDIKYLNQIDIESDDFNNLPPDVKQEMLSTLKESRKHRTWEQFEELPKESNEFSSYQVQNLLKKRKLTHKLEEVQKDMREVTSLDFVARYTSDHVIGETNKIMSDDTSHYVLLKKIVQNNQSNKDVEENIAGSSTMIDIKSTFIKDMENIDVLEEYERNNVDSKPKNEVITAGLEMENHLTSNSYEDYEIVDDPPTAISTQQEKYAVKENLIESESIISDSNDKENRAKSEVIEVKDSDSVKKLTETRSLKNSFQILDVPNEDFSSDLSDANNTLAEDNSLIDVSSSDELVSCDEFDVEDDFVSIVCKSSVVLPSLTSSNKTSLENQNVVSKEIAKENVSSQNNIHLTNDLHSNDSSEFTKLTNSSQFKTVEIVEDKQPTKTNIEVPIQSTSSEPRSNKDRIEAAERQQQLQDDLNAATKLLEADQAKQDRQSRTVQEHMVEECKELLQLFGIPFVVSPTEAEAQCAFYDLANLSHGTITDDSDVWLFGGKRVYKNFFTQQKYVEFFKDHEVFTHFGLNREKLISFAMLTGSDYTEGIEGVGPVTAMEILSEFPGEGLDILHQFKEWWKTSNAKATKPENKVRAKLLKLVLSEDFPDERIQDAYLHPAIDESTEKFTWGRPDLDALREYTNERFGWNKSKVDEALLPVIKKLGDRDTQTHLDSFFTVSLKKQTELFPSKRIMSALKKMTSPVKDGGVEVKAASKKRTKSDVKKTVAKKVGRKLSKNTRYRKVATKVQVPVLSEESSNED